MRYTFLVEQHPFEKELSQIAEQCKEWEFAQELYAALCNNFWVRKGVKYTAKEHDWFTEDGQKAYNCSWRYAGGVADDLRSFGKVLHGSGYVEFYSSGNEGQVSERIAQALDGLGWEMRSS